MPVPAVGMGSGWLDAEELRMAAILARHYGFCGEKRQGVASGAADGVPPLFVTVALSVDANDCAGESFLFFGLAQKWRLTILNTLLGDLLACHWVPCSEAKPRLGGHCGGSGPGGAGIQDFVCFGLPLPPACRRPRRASRPRAMPQPNGVVLP